MRNVAIEYLRCRGQDLEEYDGCCGELADALIHEFGEDRVGILYIKGDLQGPDGDLWRYHMVPVVDGVVHDAWFPDVVEEPEVYVSKVFPGPDVRFYVT